MIHACSTKQWVWKVLCLIGRIRKPCLCPLQIPVTIWRQLLMFGTRGVGSLGAIPTSVPVYFTTRCVQMRERKDKVCIFACMHLCIHKHTKIFNILPVVLGPTHLTRKEIISLSTFYFHSIRSQISSPHVKAKIRRRKRKYHELPTVFVLQVFFLFHSLPYACQHYLWGTICFSYYWPDILVVTHERDWQ